MSNHLYLQPPTYGEMFFALTKYIGSQCSYEIIKRALFSTYDGWFYRHRFSLPLNIVDGDDENLRQLLQQITPGLNDDFEFFYEQVEFYEQFLKSYNRDNGSLINEIRRNYLHAKRDAIQALEPSHILERQIGDCKSLALLSVCFKRQAGRYARFISHEEDHLTFQEFVDSVWVDKDPMLIRRGEPTPQSTIPDAYDEFYEMTLRLFQ